MNDKIPLNKHVNLVSIFIFIILTLANAILFYSELISLTIALIGLAATLFIAATLKISDQWEKAVVLRMGKFIGLKGPGWFLIIPIIDRVDKYIDQRVRVTDIRADSTLTKDTVPVNVDAVVYWTVWDAEKAALEVQEYEYAVSLADWSARHHRQTRIGRSPAKSRKNRRSPATGPRRNDQFLGHNLSDCRHQRHRYTTRPRRRHEQASPGRKGTSGPDHPGHSRNRNLRKILPGQRKLSQ